MPSLVQFYADLLRCHLECDPGLLALTARRLVRYPLLAFYFCQWLGAGSESRFIFTMIQRPATREADGSCQGTGILLTCMDWLLFTQSHSGVLVKEQYSSRGLRLFFLFDHSGGRISVGYMRSIQDSWAKTMSRSKAGGSKPQSSATFVTHGAWLWRWDAGFKCKDALSQHQKGWFRFS